MRKEVNIIWLDDKKLDRARSLRNRKELVEKLIADKGYIPKITMINDIELATEELVNNNRIDFFITDFNISEDTTGLTYLKRIRQERSYKQFVILYSAINREEIIDAMKHYLDTSNIQFFANFSFFSLQEKLDAFYLEEAIDIILCRWDELNGLRGRYMCENAEIEHFLKLVLGKKLSELYDYCALIDEIKGEWKGGNKRELDKFFNRWHRLREYRNDFAHAIEKQDKEGKFYIQSLKNSSNLIYEAELNQKRKEILEIKSEVLDFLKRYNTYYPLPKGSAEIEWPEGK